MRKKCRRVSSCATRVELRNQDGGAGNKAKNKQEQSFGKKTRDEVACGMIGRGGETMLVSSQGGSLLEKDSHERSGGVLGEKFNNFFG